MPGFAPLAFQMFFTSVVSTATLAAAPALKAVSYTHLTRYAGGIIALIMSLGYYFVVRNMGALKLSLIHILDAQARLGHTAQTSDNGLAVSLVLQCDNDGTLNGVVLHLHALDAVSYTHLFMATLCIFFLAAASPLRIASGTSPDLPMP